MVRLWLCARARDSQPGLGLHDVGGCSASQQPPCSLPQCVGSDAGQNWYNEHRLSALEEERKKRKKKRRGRRRTRRRRRGGEGAGAGGKEKEDRRPKGAQGNGAKKKEKMNNKPERRQNMVRKLLL